MPLRGLGIVSRTYRHINRYRQILTILVKYGFGEVVDRLRISQYIEIGLQFISRGPQEPTVEHSSTAERIRMVLEELGPTFIKLGQVLSTRPDLIPVEIADELSKLQQSVPPFPFEDARNIIESELGKPLDELYASFQEEPIAAASIGQVHRATLTGGECVAVKVQRPDIRAVIEADLEILLHLAALYEKHVEAGRLFRPTKAVEEFTRVLEKELDFSTEAANLQRFAALFADDETIHVPRMYHARSAKRVLTQEFIDGVPLGDMERLDAIGADRRRVAARGMELTLKQVFVHGFFHADPHPGNIFVLPDDVICLLDFGMVGRLDRRTREDFADLLYAVTSRDASSAASALMHLTEHDADVDVDVRAVERDVADFIDVNLAGGVAMLDIGRLVHETLDLIHRHELRVPADLVTMFKALTTIERVAAGLDPDLNMVAATEPYVRRLKFDRLTPRRVLHAIAESGSELLQLTREFPRNMRDLINLARHGKLRIAFEHRGLENMLDTNERIANRVSFAIVVASLIVGSSLIVHSNIPPHWHGVPLIGIGGFLAAGIMGLMLLVSMIRHGRM